MPCPACRDSAFILLCLHDLLNTALRAAEHYTGWQLDVGNVTYRAYRSVQFVVSLLVRAPHCIRASSLPTVHSAPAEPCTFQPLPPPLAMCRHRAQLSMRINRAFNRWCVPSMRALRGLALERCSSSEVGQPLGADKITRCSKAISTYWPPNRWDARNGFRGAGSAVVALCYQCPVWGVDPAIVVRPGVACRRCMRCLLSYMWCAHVVAQHPACADAVHVTLPMPAGMHSQVGRCLAFLAEGRAVWREAAGGYCWSLTICACLP